MPYPIFHRITETKESLSTFRGAIRHFVVGCPRRVTYRLARLRLQHAEQTRQESSGPGKVPRGDESRTRAPVDDGIALARMWGEYAMSEIDESSDSSVISDGDSRRGRDSGWHSHTATDGIQSYDERRSQWRR